MRVQFETALHQDKDRDAKQTTKSAGHVPARYVWQSQMCPQLDMSDINDQKTHDMSEKARCVRQKSQNISRYARQMKTKCKICLTGHNYNFQAIRMAFKPTYSNYTSIFSTHNTIHLEIVPHNMSLTTCYLITCLMYAHGYNLRFSEKRQQNTHYFLSDISCVFFFHFSDKSRFVGHILRLLVIFVGHIYLWTHLAMPGGHI